MDRYVTALTRKCRLFPYHGVGADTLPDAAHARRVLERWVHAGGWGEETVEARADVLLRLVDFLHDALAGPVPIAWLVFPFNATLALLARAETCDDEAVRQRDQRCAAALLCYAASLQNRCANPALILDVCGRCPRQDLSFVEQLLTSAPWRLRASCARAPGPGAHLTP